MTYYKTINGIKYDRELLELTDQLTQHRPIDLVTIKQIWAEVSDGGQITPTEKITLHYIQHLYPISQEAQNWIAQQLTPATFWEDQINSILREKLDLPDLQWEMDQEQLTQLLKENQQLNIEMILSGVLQAIYNNSLGYFALWHVSRNQRLQKIWINKGTLSLLNPEKDQDRLTPGFWKNEKEWLHFILDIPTFSPFQLVIYIRANSPSAYGFCKSLIKRELALATSLDEIVSERLKTKQLVIGKHWEWAEEEEQFLTDFGLGWRDGLYLALSDGVCNQESDITFQTAFLWEDWFEMEGFDGTEAARRRFLKSASIHYIPRHFQTLAEEDEILAQIPKDAKLDFDNFWYYLLLSEVYPDRRLITYCRKSGDGIEAAWHDLYFTADEAPLGDQIDKVAKEEFELLELAIQVDPMEFERQKASYRKGWRPTKTIFRQLLNCVLKDEVSADSFLQLLFSGQADLSAAPEAFTPSAKAKFYLNKSSIQLKAIEASTAEQVKNYWIFSLQTPALAGRIFEVYVPRVPDFEEVSGVPYNQAL
ncbi:MAG: hypothetical protein KTR30_17120 [Saprospiraceae bacterium]|nr:hypothetical protein [Saprospiraceae bacterium]